MSWGELMMVTLEARAAARISSLTEWPPVTTMAWTRSRMAISWM